MALPFLHSTQVIYYNKTMADANGWTIPEKIEDFTPFLAEVHKTAGVYGTVVPGWDQWYFETMYLNEGVQIITDDNTCDLGSDTALVRRGRCLLCNRHRCFRCHASELLRSEDVLRDAHLFPV